MARWPGGSLTMSAIPERRFPGVRRAPGFILAALTAPVRHPSPRGGHAAAAIHGSIGDLALDCVIGAKVRAPDLLACSEWRNKPGHRPSPCPSPSKLAKAGLPLECPHPQADANGRGNALSTAASASLAMTEKG